MSGGSRRPGGNRPPEITVDPMRCVSNAMCVSLAPGVFAHNELYQSEVVNPDGATLDEIVKAASSCPTEAISVRDADTGALLFP